MPQPTDPVSRMVDFWQEQMRGAMHDERMMTTLLDSMLEMQQIMRSTLQMNESGAVRPETPAGASGDESSKSGLLARRLSLCEERLADLESRLADLESR